MKRTLLTTIFGGLLFVTTSAGAVPASELLTGPQIIERIAGNTLEGRRLDMGHVVEFYSLEGRVLAQGYEALWHVEDDQLCFQQASDRLDDHDPGYCYRLSMVGEDLQWLDPDGKFEGQARVLPGNAFGF